MSWAAGGHIVSGIESGAIWRWSGFLQINLTFFLSSIFHRRIQSQHNLLEKELAEHTIDFLKSSNIRIIEKVSKIIELEKIALHNAAGPIKPAEKFVVCTQLFSLFVLILPSPSRRHLREWHTEQRRVYAMMMIKKVNATAHAHRISGEKRERSQRKKGYFSTTVVVSISVAFVYNRVHSSVFVLALFLIRFLNEKWN